MPDYLLDGEPQTMDVPQECWGKLLETVDRRLESDGRAVSAVRFGGVDQPSFRSETLARRPLATVGSIEITTSDASELLVETIATARRSIPVLSGSAVRLAAEFRGADPAKAARQLSELVDALRTLTVLTAAIADVVELRGPERPPLHASAVAVGVGDALRTLIDRHAAQDWARAAECLDRDLAPAILSWHSIFDQLEDRREAA
jgi:hypothetical protein